MLSRKTIIILTVALALAGAVWYGFSSGSSSGSILSTQTPDNSATSADQDLVTTLLTLKAVSLSGTILSDLSFKGLKDFSTQIVQEPMGRPDPFAPLAAPPAPDTSAGNTKLFKSVSP